MNPISHEPIFSKLAFYLKNPKDLYELIKTCKDLFQIGMLPNYKAKLYDFKVGKASIYGDLSVIIWLHNNKYKFPTNAINRAVINGHLEVIKWLHKNRTEGCTHWAMDFAAEYGHLEVVKWLHENRK
ncbi:MAG: ankyrin repeat domain-containing protein, partial [Candidatus Paceibacterota bacterium]